MGIRGIRTVPLSLSTHGVLLIQSDPHSVSASTVRLEMALRQTVCALF